MLERAPFGIEALDKMIGGGVVKGSATVVEGAPGTGKTTLGMQFKKYEDQGLLKIIFSDPSTVAGEVEELGGALETLIDEMGIKRCLVDSLTHFEYAAEEPDALREMESDFISSLKREGITSLLLRENSNLLGDTSSLSQAPFIADNYFILRYVEISKAILVLKMRGSQHAKDIRQFHIAKGGIEIMDKFVGRQGVMSGSPVKTDADTFVEAFSAFGKRKGK
jgi:circadian clock protein KaiC